MKKMLLTSVAALCLVFSGSGSSSVVEASSNVCDNTNANYFDKKSKNVQLDKKWSVENKNLKITFFEVDEGYGYYENANRQKISLKNPEMINEVEKAKAMAACIIDKHLNDLSKKGIDVDKLLEDNPLNVEIFPYAAPGYYGWFQGKDIWYWHPAIEMALAMSDGMDKIVYVEHNVSRTATTYKFNGELMETVLIHEFGHYIAHNYLDYNGYMDFLEIKGLHNTGIANYIDRMDVQWEMRPAEIFAENYADTFLEKFDYRVAPLTREQQIRFENWLFNKMK